MSSVARIILLADTAEADAKMAASADIAQKSAQDIGAAGTAEASKFSTAFEDSASKTSGAFSKLGSKAESMGLPFGSAFTKMGEAIDGADTKGKKFLSTVSEMGKMALGVGVAGFAAIGAESIHMADQFDVAQAALKTAVTNSGVSWAAFAPQADKAYQSMAGLGFENNEVATSLQTLTTATNSPKQALSMLGLAANMARLRHISLTEATQNLTKILGGSTRVLNQWGVNLDIGSGKLHSVQSAEFALKTATLDLAKTQAEVSNGQLIGAQASGSLASAQLRLQQATLNLKQSQQAIPTVLAALEQRTKGAAAAFGNTLAGEMDKAKATVHNLGVSFGEFLLPKLLDVVHAVASVISWFQRHRMVAEALAVTIGTVLGGAIAVFIGTKIAGLINGITGVVGKFLAWRTSVAETNSPVNQLNASLEMQERQVSTLVAAIQTTQPVLSQFDDMEQLTATTAEVAAQANEALAESYRLLGEEAPLAADAIDTSESSMLATTDTTSMGMRAALITTGIGAALVVLGLVVVELQSHWESAWHDMLTVVKGVAQDIENALSIAFNTIVQIYDDTLGKLHFSLLGHNIGMPSINKTAEPGWASFGGMNWKSNSPTTSPVAVPGMPSLPGGNLNGIGNQTPGGAIPTLPSAGTVGANAAGTNPEQNAGLSLLQSFQGALQEGSINGLRRALTSAANEKMQLLVQQLVSTHQAALVSLAAQIVAAHTAAMQELVQLLAIQQQVALADQTQMMATEMTDITTIMAQMATTTVQAITDSSQIAQDRATAQAQMFSDQGKIQADIIGERGLYGLNLVAQQMQVGLDRMTMGFDKRIAIDQQRVDAATKVGNAAIGAAQQRLDTITKTQDAAIQAAQTKVDLAATGTQLQQQQAQAALKTAQSHAALVEAQANRTLQDAKDAESYKVAQANRILTEAQSNAKVAEAKEAEQIAIEQARAQKEFAGSGVHIEITGINPTDAAAVATAVGWKMRSKVPAY